MNYLARDTKPMAPCCLPRRTAAVSHLNAALSGRGCADVKFHGVSRRALSSRHGGVPPDVSLVAMLLNEWTGRRL